MPAPSQPPENHPRTDRGTPKVSTDALPVNPLAVASFTARESEPPAASGGSATKGVIPASVGTSVDAPVQARSGALGSSRVATLVRDLLVAPSLPEVSEKFPITGLEKAGFYLAKTVHTLGRVAVGVGVVTGVGLPVGGVASHFFFGGSVGELMMVGVGPVMGAVVSLAGLHFCFIAKRLQQSENAEIARTRERWERNGKPAPLFTRDNFYRALRGMRDLSMVAGLIEPAPEVFPNLRTDLTFADRFLSRLQSLVGSAATVGGFGLLGRSFLEVAASDRALPSISNFLNFVGTTALGVSIAMIGGRVAVHGFVRRLHRSRASDSAST